MKVLLLHDAADTATAAAIDDAGHTLVHCSDDRQRPLPCLGMAGACPLDGTVDVAVVVHERATADVAAGEVGAVCARRDGVPLVLVGTGAPTPLGHLAAVTAAGPREVVAACERAVAEREARLGRMVGGAVTIREGKVLVRLPPWRSTADVVRAHQDLSTAVPGARSIDIGTGPEPMMGP